MIKTEKIASETKNRRNFVLSVIFLRFSVSELKNLAQNNFGADFLIRNVKILLKMISERFFDSERKISVENHFKPILSVETQKFLATE